MKHTVIALFDRQEEARKAADALVAAGFDRTDVHYGDSAEAGPAQGSTRVGDPAQAQAQAAGEPVLHHVPASAIIEGGTGVRGRLYDFFTNLFGGDDTEPHAAHYGEAVRRGGTLVSVHAEDETQAARARDALLSSGAVNIDDRVEEWRRGGWESSSTQAGVSPEGRSGTVVHRQEASIGGVRVYGHAEPHGYEHYAGEFRDDHAARYAGQGGSYDDYDSAYRYGHGLASDTRYSGRDWEDIESDVRADWEKRYPDSAWERFKGAVRHAWERVAR